MTTATKSRFDKHGEYAEKDSQAPVMDQTVSEASFVNRNGVGDYSKEEWATRCDLAAMFRLADYYGWSDTVWGHITARVPYTNNHFLMHKFGLLYNEVCASNLIKVNGDGKVLEGPANVNVAGFVIQSAIHLNHPNNHFVFHTHATSALLATAFDELPFIVQDSAMLYGKIRYHDWEGESVELDERERIADNLGDGKCLIMRNHGLLTVGETAGEAFMNMYYLVRMCEIAIQSTFSKSKINIPTNEQWVHAEKQYKDFPPGKYEWPVLLKMCDQLDHSYKY